MRECQEDIAAIVSPHNRRKKSGKSDLSGKEEKASLLGWGAGRSECGLAEKIVRAKRDKNIAESRTDKSSYRGIEGAKDYLGSVFT